MIDTTNRPCRTASLLGRGPWRRQARSAAWTPRRRVGWRRRARRDVVVDLDLLRVDRIEVFGVHASHDVLSDSSAEDPSVGDARPRTPSPAAGRRIIGRTQRDRQHPPAVGLADQQDAAGLAAPVRRREVPVTDQLHDLGRGDAVPSDLGKVVFVENADRDAAFRHRRHREGRRGPRRLPRRLPRLALANGGLAYREDGGMTGRRHLRAVWGGVPAKPSDSIDPASLWPRRSRRWRDSCGVASRQRPGSAGDLEISDRSRYTSWVRDRIGRPP
jgi:hypothetical protein